MDKEIHYQLWFEFGFDFTLSLDLWHENVCFCIEFNCVDKKLAFKVHIFWEGHKILQKTLLLSYVVPVKSKVKILQNFVTFSKYMNFIKKVAPGKMQ